MEVRTLDQSRSPATRYFPDKTGVALKANAHRIDMRDDDGANLVDHLAGVGDFEFSCGAHLRNHFDFKGRALT
jgi:hypothetical protein